MFLNSDYSIFDGGWQGFISEGESRALFRGTVGHVPAHDELHDEIVEMFERLDTKTSEIPWRLRILECHATCRATASAAYSDYLAARRCFLRCLSRFAHWILPSQLNKLKFEKKVLQPTAFSTPRFDAMQN